jgi:hypothetical protein
MTMTTFADLVLGWVVRVLPRSSRRRYEAELDAEMRELPARRRPGFALSMLAGAPRLRWEVLGATSPGAVSMRCLVGRHGRRVTHPVHDHRVVVHVCPRCGHVRDPRQYGAGNPGLFGEGSVVIARRRR